MLRCVWRRAAAVAALSTAGFGPAWAENRVPAPAATAVQTAPVQTAPVQTLPIQAIPVHAAPSADLAKPATSKPATVPTAPAAAPVVPPPVEVSSDPRPTLSPGTFVATIAAADRYRALAAAGGWPVVPNGITRAKVGERGPAIALLRRRLAAEGDLLPELGTGDVLDEATTAALRTFQFRHGLPEGSLVGPLTLAALNVPVETRVRQLEASAGRLLGSTFPFGGRYVAVNIPSATVEAVENGSVARRYVAIVGKPDRPSPTIGAQIQSVNINPTWTVPASLVRKDIIPHMRKDPGYLAKMHIRVLDRAGGEVSPTTIDWSTENAVNYLLREDPGPENSLGQVRIDMPNKLAVYMHDTPSKHLFARSTRLQSSGCVRVSGVRDLAAWLLAGSPGPGGPGTTWGPAEIDGAVASLNRVDVKLTRAVPVAWVYLTGYATPDGTVHFRPDVYGLDKPATDPAPKASVPTPAAPPPAAAQAGAPAPPAAPASDPAVTGALGTRTSKVRAH